MMLANVVAATLIGGVCSLLVAALIAFRVPTQAVRSMIGFAAGVLLAAALLDIVPEALASGISPAAAGGAALTGIVLLHLMERISLWRHRHPGVHPQSVARVSAIVVGDGMHNFVDGVLIAAAFASDPLLGWTTTAAVVAHEIPQELGDFLLLRDAGLAKWEALLLNALSSLASVVGGLVGWAGVSRIEAAVPYLLALAGGTFIYIAMSDLMPIMRTEFGRRTAVVQSGAMLFGIGLIAAVSRLVH